MSLRKLLSAALIAFTAAQELLFLQAAQPKIIKLTDIVAQRTHRLTELNLEQDVKNEVNQDLTRKENQLAVFLKPLEKYYGAILIAAGIVLAFYGNKFLTFVIHFVVAVAIIFVGGDLVFWAFTTNTPEWLKIVAFVIVFSLAVFIGFIVSGMRKLGIFLVAGAAGCSLGMTIATAANQTNSKEVYYGIMLGTGLLCGIAAFFIETLIVILATAFIGAFSLCYGVSKYAHHFPNVLTLKTEVSHGDYNKVSDW